MSLPNPITCSYNGWTFGTESQIRTNSRFKYDGAGRTVVSTTLKVTVKSHILAGGTQDATLDNIRAALERPGGQLVLTGLGFGTLSINTAGGSKDLNWGPKPDFLLWEPTGRDRAAKITWECEVNLLGCVGAKDSGAVMEATYSVSFATDKGGYCTRTFHGEIAIPITRASVGSTAVPDSVDKYFEDYVPDKPSSADRAITRNIDSSAGRLTFTVTDTQRAGNPPPPGVVEVSGSHVLTSSGKLVTNAWVGALSATYETEAGRPRSDAWLHFLKLVADRIGVEVDGGRATFVPVGLTFGEPELYGRQGASLTLNYALIIDAGKPREFPTRGVWRKTPGADWPAWSKSLANGAQSDRGLSGWKHDQKDDRIIDLCQTATIQGRLKADPPPAKDGLLKVLWNDVLRTLRAPAKPNPAATWMAYVNRVIIEPVNNRLAHVPIAKEPLTESRLHTPNWNNFEQGGPPFQLEAQESPAPIVQRRASTTYFVRMVGHALRYFYEIPRPQVREVAGQKAIEMNHPELGCYWAHWAVTWTSAPIWAAKWNLRWFVTREDNAPPAVVEDSPIPGQQSSLNSAGSGWTAHLTGGGNIPGL